MERSSAIRCTYQDLQSIPGEVRRHEIVDGKLYVTAAPRVNHQRVVMDLGAMMLDLARDHALGEVNASVAVHVHDEMVFEPDLIFIRADGMHIVDPEGDVHGLPDLVVEVLSPSTRAYDEDLKRKHYLESGVPELWLVDIDARSVEVWRAGENEPVVVVDELRWRVRGRAFSLRLEEVFRGVR